MSGGLGDDFGGTFPYEPRYLDADGTRLHYVDVGPRDGGAILMLHGNPTWSYMYRTPIARLSERGHRCIAFDHMGFGRSDKPPEPKRYVLANHIANALEMIDGLDLNDVTLVLHDWGGPIGLGAALERPDKVKAIVAMNTWAWELPSFLPPWLRQFRTEGLGEILALANNVPVEAIPGGMYHRDTDGTMMEAYRAPFESYWTRVGTLGFIRDIPLTEHDTSAPVIGAIHAELEAFDRPMHLIWGMRDPVFVPAFIEQWQELFPEAQATEIHTAAHYLVEDEPEQVASAIAAFVETV
ncbi:MAG TPA: alpha/beta fold hydrolase [Thermoleophilaceae bacterium]